MADLKPTVCRRIDRFYRFPIIIICSLLSKNILVTIAFSPSITIILPPLPKQAQTRYSWKIDKRASFFSLSGGRDIVADGKRLNPSQKDEFVRIKESCMETMMDGGYLLRKAVRTDDTSGNRGEVNPSSNDKFSDDEFSDDNYYAGYLVQSDASASEQSLEDNDDNICSLEPVLCEAQISSFHAHSTTELPLHSIRYHASCQVLNSLFHHFLLLEKCEGSSLWTYVLRLSGDCALLLDAAHDRGFSIIEEELYDEGEEESNTKVCVMKWDNPFRTLRCMTEYAFSSRGTSEGLIALEILGMMSERRVPFQFEGQSNSHSNNDDDIREGEGNLNQNVDHGRIPILNAYRQIIPNDTLCEVQLLMDVIKRNGWLSTNLDSVDQLPSLHLNLVTNGSPKFNGEDGEKTSTSTDRATGYGFQTCVTKMLELLKPHLYGKLLSKAQQYTNSSGVEISEIFIRSYGQDLQPSEFGAASRNGISAHYDVFSSLTAVIALDDVAIEGKSGLYTFFNPNTIDSDHTYTSAASKHPSLRRYFPLEAGDGVLHSWDVLHGVSIERTLTRTSLIVWFTDNSGQNESIDSTTPPWLANPYDQDDVGNFVLATAIESVDGGFEANTNFVENSNENDMIPPDDNSIANAIPKDDNVYRRGLHPHDLYLKSASLGNAFALCRLASLCELSSDILLQSLSMIQLRDMLCNLNSLSENRNIRSENDFLKSIDEGRISTFRAVAKGLWFEAAMRGDLSAQLSLAAACMEDFMSLPKSEIEERHPSHEEDILIATVLFSMAAQQGDEGALEALARVLGIHRSYFTSDSDNELFDDNTFLNSPISKTVMVVASLI